MSDDDHPDRAHQHRDHPFGGRPAGDQPAGDNGYEDHRHHLFGVAYRMLGSVADAEDVAQDAWLRWSQVDAGAVQDQRAFLTTVVSRLALDRLRSAHHRRETYVGPWLPEPLPTGPAGRDRVFGAAEGAGPEEAAELADSLTFAFLTLLDRLEPDERVVLLLHDVFGYRFGEIAHKVQRSETGCRQLASRARRRLRAERASSTARGDARPSPEVVDGFLTALVTGDIDGVLGALAPDVVLVSDGGPHHHAARRPVIGARRVGRLLVNLGGRTPAGAGFERLDINGEPGVLVTVDGAPFATIGLGGAPEGIDRIWFVRNPDKLAHLARRDGDPLSPGPR
ncbi:RNA polymerase sigma-70 factor [soil metagenome]